MSKILFPRLKQLFLGSVFALAFSCALSAEARVIWIDTDLSLGSPLREVDDAYALLFAARSPELCIAGISTTYGNAPLAATTARTGDWARRINLRCAISAGAAAREDLGKATAATAALARALRENEKLTYVALGPLTNLATFLRLHPSAAKQIAEIVLVGSRSPEAALHLGRLEIHDANVVKDPASLHVVLESNIPILLAPIETSAQLLLTPQDLQSLNDNYLARKSSVWLWFWTHPMGLRGGPLFDLLPMLAITHPSSVVMENRYAVCDAHANFIAARHPTKTTRRVRFCSALAPGAMSFAVSRLANSRTFSH